MNSVVRYLIHKGVPSNKIILGMSLFAKSYELANHRQNTPGSSVLGLSGSFEEVILKLCLIFSNEYLIIIIFEWFKFKDFKKEWNYQLL